jgi:hypothetical protein
LDSSFRWRTAQAQGGNIAAEAVINSAPDGYTILIVFTQGKISERASLGLDLFSPQVPAGFTNSARSPLHAFAAQVD